jgi:hypothetical protein
MSVDGRLRNELTHDASEIDIDAERFLGVVVARGRRRRRLRQLGGVTVVAAVLGVAVLTGPAIVDLIRTQRNEPAHPSPPVSIVGTYTTRIERADAAALRGLHAEGQWLLTIRSDGVIAMTGPAGAEVSTPGTRYEIDGDRILTSAFASQTCSGVGAYRWSRDGSALTLILESDACQLRIAILTGHTWTAS